MCVCACASLVARLCLTLCDAKDCSPPGSSVHGILQARTLGWVAIPFSRGPSQPRDWTQVSFIVGRFFTIWATREAHKTHMVLPKFNDAVFSVEWIQHRLSTFHYCCYFGSGHWSWQPRFSVHGNESLIADVLQVMCLKRAFKWISIKSINNPSLTLPVN